MMKWSILFKVYLLLFIYFCCCYLFACLHIVSCSNLIFPPVVVVMSSANVDAQPVKCREMTAKTVGADCTTALAVALTAAIPISIIDYSIMARVAGVTNSSIAELFRGAKTVLFRPHRFFLPCAENKCALVYYVCATTYGLTYVGSNVSKSYCESHGMAERANLTAGVVSGVINTVLTVWKDSIILKALPPVNPNDLSSAKKPVPWITRGLFCGRDTLTCIGAFTIAPMLASWLSKRAYHYRSAKSIEDTKDKFPLPLSTADTAQIITPAMLQFVTTLMHISAIRYRQTYPNFTWKDLSDSLKATYISATLLRMCRIFPAFGLGGIFNRNLRSDLLTRAQISDSN